MEDRTVCDWCGASMPLNTAKCPECGKDPNSREPERYPRLSLEDYIIKQRQIAGLILPIGGGQFFCFHDWHRVLPPKVIVDRITFYDSFTVKVVCPDGLAEIRYLFIPERERCAKCGKVRRYVSTCK